VLPFTLAVIEFDLLVSKRPAGVYQMGTGDVFETPLLQVKVEKSFVRNAFYSIYHLFVSLQALG